MIIMFLIYTWGAAPYQGYRWLYAGFRQWIQQFLLPYSLLRHAENIDSLLLVWYPKAHLPAEVWLCHSQIQAASQSAKQCFNKRLIKMNKSLMVHLVRLILSNAPVLACFITPWHHVSIRMNGWANWYFCSQECYKVWSILYTEKAITMIIMLFNR